MSHWILQLIKKDKIIPALHVHNFYFTLLSIAKSSSWLTKQIIQELQKINKNNWHIVKFKQGLKCSINNRKTHFYTLKQYRI